MSFTSTSLGGGAGTYGFTVNGPELVPGPFTTSGTATIAVGGTGVLTLTATTGPQLAGSTFQVGSGATLLAVGQDSFQGAAITLSNGGNLMLGAIASTTSYDLLLPTSANRLTLPASGTGTILGGIGAGPSGLSGALAAGGMNSRCAVTLASTGTLTVASGQTLALGSLNNYTLVVPASLTLANKGTISVVTGTVVIASAYNSLANSLGVTGGATLVLSSSNGMSGTLAVAGGSFVAGNSASFGSATLQFSGGTIGANAPLTGANAIANPVTWSNTNSINIGGSAPIEFSRAISLSGGVCTINDPGGYSTFSGVISGGGGLSVSGFPTLSNSNTYSGGAILSNGTATVTSPKAFGSGPLSFAGGGFQATVPLIGALAVTNAWSVPTGSATFSGTNTIELTQGTNLNVSACLNVSDPNGHVIIDGPLTGSGGLSLWINQSPGMLTLASRGSTYSGWTSLTRFVGRLDVPVSSVGPAGAPTSGPLGTGEVYVVNDYVGSINPISIGNYSGGAAVTIANPLNVNSGQWGCDGGRYGLTFTGPITLDNSCLTYINNAVTFAGNISGNTGNLSLRAGSNWHTGGGLTLSGSNSFSGGVSISQGTLIVAGSAALSPSSSMVTLNDSNTATTGDGISALLIGGAYAVANPITLTANGCGSFLGGNTADRATFSGPISLAKSVGLVAAPGGTATFSGPLSGAGGVVAGTSGYTGTVILSGPNTYSGGTTVSGGTLTLANSAALQQSTLDTSGGGALSFGSLSAATLGEMTGTGGLALTNTASQPVTLTVGNNGLSATYSGSLSGSGSVVKVGTGRWTLGAANTYSGMTTVSGGVLVAGTAAALSPYSDMTVSGGTLDASGYPNTVKSLTVTSGGALGLGVGSLLSCTGPATLAGTLIVSGQGSGVHELLAYGSETGSFATVNGLPADYRLQYKATELDVVPEPSTFALLGAGAVLLASCASRKRRRVGHHPTATTPSNGTGNRSPGWPDRTSFRFRPMGCLFLAFTVILAHEDRTVAAPVQLDQQYFSGVGSTQGPYVAQTFTVGINGTLAKVEIELDQSSGATFDIRPTSGGAPAASDSSALANVALPNVPQFFPEVYDVDLSSFDIPVVQGEVLAFTLSGHFQVSMNTGPAYGGGPDLYTRGAAYIRGFPAWSPLLGGGADLDFRTYVQPTPEPSTLALLGVGAIGLLAYGWRRRKQAE